MNASRTGKPYSSVALILSLAVPVEVIAGGAQPRVENEIRQPGFVRLNAPAITGINVSAQSISGGFNLQPAPMAVAHIVGAPAILRGPSIPASICPQPRYNLTSSESAFTRSSSVHAGKFRGGLRGHTIRGEC